MLMLSAVLALVAPSSNPVDARHAFPASTAELCDRLSEIRRMPFEDEHVDDEIYNQIMAKGKAIVPCLIDQLTNRTRMADPRSEPAIGDFSVGDVAFFLLLRITRVPFEAPLPNRVKARLKDDGVYAYFRYAEAAKNRAALQRWWRSWLKRQAPQLRRE